MRAHTRVLADDLTGAADAAVAVGGSGATLLLDRAHPGWLAPESPVTVLDTDTRSLGAGRAAELLDAVAADLHDTDTVLKKIDSLLRGHIGTEVGALARRLPSHLVVVAPAFPATGRTTVDGIVQVNGTPLHRTGLWDLERHEPPENVAAALAPLRCQGVGLDAVRGRPGALAAALDRIGAAAAVAVCDAETDADLAAITLAGGATGRQVLWVGTAGLAGALGADGRPAAPPPGQGHAPGSTPPGDAPPGSARQVRTPSVRGPFLAVIGSGAATAGSQAERMVAHGAQEIVVPAGVLLGPDTDARLALAERITRAAHDGDTVVRIGGEHRHGTGAEAGRRLAALVEEGTRRCGLLVLTGGATARAVLLRIGVGSLRIDGELEPGVVLSHSPGAGARSIITKAGAFGDADTLGRAVRRARD